MLPTSSAVPWASVVTVSPRPARVSSTQAAVATRASSSVVTAAGRLAGVGTGGTCVWADEGEERAGLGRREERRRRGRFGGPMCSRRCRVTKEVKVLRAQPVVAEEYFRVAVLVELPRGRLLPSICCAVAALI